MEDKPAPVVWAVPYDPNHKTEKAELDRYYHPDVFNLSTAYKGNLSWLSNRTIFLSKHGSHAYGTNIQSSDLDIKGVAIPPKEYFFGFVDSFEQADKGFGEYDCQVYEIRKFCSLAADNNPNMIEILFIDESDWVKAEKPWLKLVEIRNDFLSQNIKHRFSGYAISQLKRILTHRRWLLNPLKQKPERKDFNLPDFTAIPHDQLAAAEAQIQKQLEAWEVDWAVLDEANRINFMNQFKNALSEMKLYDENRYLAAANKLGFSDNFMEHLKKERAYRSAMAEWKQYTEWVNNRNKDRSELELKYGYDTKHAMHLVRLMRMCREILQGKGVFVKRPDAEELLAIRNGSWKYDDLIEWAGKQDAELTEIMKTSPLPKQPKRNNINQLVITIIEESLK